jgi:hypothetical protein
MLPKSDDDWNSFAHVECVIELVGNEWSSWSYGGYGSESKEPKEESVDNVFVVGRSMFETDTIYEDWVPNNTSTQTTSTCTPTP